MDNGEYAVYIELGKDHITRHNHIGSTNVKNTTTTDSFHTWRLNIEPNGKFNLHKDDIREPLFTGDCISSTTKEEKTKIFFGAWNSSGSGKMYIREIRVYEKPI